jgi:uncharacterized protein YecT (DUF1311 family)
MLRPLLFSAVLLVAFIVHAQDAGARQRVLRLPDQIENCIKAEIKDYNTGHACIGRHAKECLSLAQQQETMLPEPCYIEEEQAWLVLIDRYFAQRPQGANGRRIVAAQRAWIAFRNAKCDGIQAHHGGSLGRWHSSMCRMEEAARQALHLRTYRANQEP